MNTHSKLARTLLFGSLYFIEGGLIGYLLIFNPIYLESFHLPFGAAGAIAVSPFILKVFIGMLSDRINLFFLGHRRPFIVAGVLIHVLGLILIPTVNPAHSYGLFLLFVFLVALGMSTFDTTADGLAIDITPAAERGYIQGVMVSARSLGSIIITLLIGLVSEHYSWPTAFIMLAVIGLVPVIFLVPVQEGRLPAEERFNPRAFRSFLSPGLGTFLVFAIINGLALYSAQTLVGLSLEHSLGISKQIVGYFSGLLYVGAVLGALLGGPSADRIGRRSTLVTAIVASTVGMFLLVFNASFPIAVVTVLLFGITFGYYEAIFLVSAMDLTDKRIAASMFAIIMAVGNIGIGLGQPIAQVLKGSVGFTVTFIIFSLVNLLALPLVYRVFQKKPTLAGVPST